MRTVGALVKVAGVMAAVSSTVVEASARNAFDASWSVAMRTTGGDCNTFTSFGIQVVNGAVEAGGSGFTLRGRVRPNGVVQATVVGADQVARAYGRLSFRGGSGSWVSRRRGCSGRWTATRF